MDRIVPRHGGWTDRGRRAFALLAGCALLSLASPSHAEAADNPTKVAKDIVAGFDNLFGGPHQGFRAGHAKGILVEGEFVATDEARSLTRAVHMQGSPVPVIVRFSDFAGVPTVADNSEGASPKGMAIKFMLPDGGSTDIVAHSYNGFPAETPEEFLAFLRALGSDDPQAFPRHLAGHPAAQRFVDTPKPAPASFATEEFFGVNAFEFTNEAGVGRFGKYYLVPVAGPRHLSEEEAAGRGPDYLMEEIAARLHDGTVRFKLLVQLAGEGDSLVDGSLPWPADREMVELGTIEIGSVSPDNASRQRSILFTPLSLVGGIAPSDDPMLVSRTRAYRVSHERRSAGHDAYPPTQ